MFVTDSQTREAALDKAGNDLHRVNIGRIPLWDPILAQLNEIEDMPVGRSSAGNLALILDICKRMEGQNILTFFYDSLSRY